MVKEKSRTQRRDIADKNWSEIIKIRAGYRCEYCGSNSYLNSHHIFSRNNFATRWDINNGVCLCSKHHVLGNFSAHKSPIEFVEWLKETRGTRWYNSLRKRASSIEHGIDYDKVDAELKKNRIKLKT